MQITNQIRKTNQRQRTLPRSKTLRTIKLSQKKKEITQNPTQKGSDSRKKPRLLFPRLRKSSSRRALKRRKRPSQTILNLK